MRVVSGVQPSGSITLGNYLGAIKQFIKLQNELEGEFFFFIADLHSLTVPQDKQELKKNIKSLAALYLACGLNPEKVSLFIQSEVPEHSMLGYIMESTVYIGELRRMTQFKDKSARQDTGIKGSLLTYPALMAADILLYDADIVPIGDDQKQHLELTRLLAERFNSQYGETFVVPKAYYQKTAARVMDLQDPHKKMSKSDENPKGVIFLLDDIRQTKNKIRSAITDSDTKVKYDKVNKPGISNLLEIYASISDLSIKEIEAKYQNANYQTFKEELANLIEELIVPIQEKYNEIIKSKELDEILDEGRNKASFVAKRKIDKVYKRIGIKR